MTNEMRRLNNNEVKAIKKADSLTMRLENGNYRICCNDRKDYNYSYSILVEGQYSDYGKEENREKVIDGTSLADYNCGANIMGLIAANVSCGDTLKIHFVFDNNCDFLLKRNIASDCCVLMIYKYNSEGRVKKVIEIPIETKYYDTTEHNPYRMKNYIANHRY